jgi:hypothetical protein
MSAEYDHATPMGGYRIHAASRNDFSDGRIRIHPPITTNASFLEYVGSEYEVILHGVVSGQEATVITFEMPAAKIHKRMTFEERLKGTVHILSDELVQIESLNEFKDINT